MGEWVLMNLLAFQKIEWQPKIVRNFCSRTIALLFCLTVYILETWFAWSFIASSTRSFCRCFSHFAHSVFLLFLRKASSYKYRSLLRDANSKGFLILHSWRNYRTKKREKNEELRSNVYSVKSWSLFKISFEIKFTFWWEIYD